MCIEQRDRSSDALLSNTSHSQEVALVALSCGPQRRAA
jgi:hypothetical protein